MLELLRAEGDLTVGDNAPYAVSDVTDYGFRCTPNGADCRMSRSRSART